VRHEADNKLVVTVGSECLIEFNTPKVTEFIDVEGLWDVRTCSSSQRCRNASPAFRDAMF
jgi:hypothetical protein